jgi:hypothetical protein
MDDGPELSEAARRGLQRAAVHLMKAAIEVVAGVGAFLEELGKGTDGDRHRREGDQGPEKIPVE